MRKILILMILLLMPVTASAQTFASFNPSAGQALPSDQLDQLLAPIALYPDSLVAQILMAATYPLEVVEAGRWAQNPANASMQRDQLAYTLDQEPWDPSVKSLVPFPQVLQTLNQNIEWTEQLGNAFLNQQADVMNSIQHLRYEAEQSGALRSTPQQSVSNQGSFIVIQPTNPDVVYIPYYNPAAVYGTWPYPEYPPYYFSGYSSAIGVGLAFAVGVAVIGPLWNWHHWDWRDHRIDLDSSRYAALNEGRPPQNAGYWQHDPDHRHGVPYDGHAGGRAVTSSGNNFRGYEPVREAGPRYAPAMSPAFNRGGEPLFQRTPGQHPEYERQQPAVRPQTVQPQYVRQSAPQIQQRLSPATQVPRAVPTPQPEAQVLRQVSQQRAAPVFESFSRGPDVRQQQARGAESRQASPAGSTQPAAHPAPAGNAHPAGNTEHERR